MKELNLKEKRIRSRDNIISIMKHDFHDITKNPIVIIVLLAIIILPSLYALINIYACWDPYESTDNIQFAIANDDKGSTYDGESFNVGDSLVEGLKNDTNFNWTFISSDELRRGVHNGTYYAGIIIPENFSDNVVSITTDNPKSGDLEYIVNEKTNPVACKLTDSAAKTVYNNMNAKIVTFINIAAYGKLGDLQSSLLSGATRMSSGATQLSGGASQVASGAGQVSSGANQLSSGASSVASGASQVSTGASQVSTGANQVSSGASQVSTGASQLSEGANQVSTGASQISESVKASSQKSPNPASSQLSDNLDKLSSGASNVANKSNELASGASQVSTGASDVASGASDVANGASQVSSGASQVSSGADALAGGALSLAAGSELLANSAASALWSASSSLYLAGNSLSDVTGVDENQIGDYFYAPVKLNRVSEYHSDNYGSQVSPFYLVLSMWVGAVITCVMLNTGTANEEEYRPHEVYGGKLLLFNIISLLQTTVTLIGCYLLGISISNQIMFIFSCYFVSLVFMLLIYSLISVFSQVGKGIAMILLVFQISGTGGIYPINIMNDVFQILYPYLPMTHAINIVREAQLGLLWSNYVYSFAYLIALGVATLIISIVLKQRFDKRTKYFQEKLEKTDLFA